MPEPRYILDTNVFIEAKNRHYGFEICPGFWKLLGHHGGHGVFSLKEIKAELAKGDNTEALVQWAKHGAPAGFFLPTDNPEVVARYAEMMRWVQDNPQFSRAAKEKFAGEADCWLAAHAKAHGPDWVVVTEEEFAPEVKKKVPLPNLCRAFDIPYLDTVGFVKELHASFDWTPPEASPDNPPRHECLGQNPGDQTELIMEDAMPTHQGEPVNPADPFADFFGDEPGE